MSRGGKRNGAGRPRDSGKFGKHGSILKRMPKQIAKIPNVGNHLIEIHGYLESQNKDLAWLAQNCRDGNFDLEKMRIINHRPGKALTYPRFDFAIAAGYGASFASYADDARFEEFDPYAEFGEPGQVTFWPVKGTSMLDAGIQPGDELLVERIEYPMTLPKSGEIVIARLDETLTVKTYKEINGKKFLIPANSELQPKELIPGEMDFHVYGIVRKLIRSF